MRDELAAVVGASSTGGLIDGKGFYDDVDMPLLMREALEADLL